MNKKVNPTKVEAYKKVIQDKYSAKINAMSEEKLTSLVEKIDKLIETINSSSKYSDTKKSQDAAEITDPNSLEEVPNKFPGKAYSLKD
jgi:uncharacterized FlaG/YvyC family protein